MKRSTDRFLTTHTGSLPRPDDLIRTMFAREEGVPVDPQALDARVAAAVAEVVAQAGRRRRRHRRRRRDEQAELRDLHQGSAGRLRRRRQHVRLPGPGRLSEARQARLRRSRPVASQDARMQRGRSGCATPRPSRRDVEHLRAALAATPAVDAFLTAASPGVVSLFFRNEHYADEETYIFAIADAMRHEYAAIVGAGFTLQVDCPDLAWAATSSTPTSRCPSGARRRSCTSRRSTTRCAASRSARAAHAPVLGQLRRPAPLRRAARRRHRHRVQGAPDAPSRSRPPIRATRTSGRVFETVKLPPGKVLIPGVIESKSNFVEHPELVAQRIARYAELVGRENVMAGSDCGYGTWVGPVGGRSRRRVGQARRDGRRRAHRVGAVLVGASAALPQWTGPAS